MNDSFYFVAILIQLFPKNIFQHGKSHTGNGRNEYMRNVCRECRLYFVHQFLIEHIALGDGKYPLLVQHFRIESAQLIQQDFIFFPDIVAVGRHHEEQQRITLEMAQKAQSQTFSGTGSFNDTGNVRHDKRLAVTVRNNTQIGFQCGEGIVGYLGLGGRYGSKQG